MGLGVLWGLEGFGLRAKGVGLRAGSERRAWGLGAGFRVPSIGNGSGFPHDKPYIKPYTLLNPRHPPSSISPLNPLNRLNPHTKA